MLTGTLFGDNHRLASREPGAQMYTDEKDAASKTQADDIEHQVNKAGCSARDKGLMELIENSKGKSARNYPEDQWTEPFRKQHGMPGPAEEDRQHGIFQRMEEIDIDGHMYIS